jgi:putative spermidine/putrescine transport system ATP-binding protein
VSSLELNQVRKTFGPTVALEQLDLALGEGELVCLLGPSGCGKTTALRIVAGFDQPDSGDVFLAGDNITRRPANKRDMGMVFQAYSLFPNLTAEENVAFGLRLRRQSAEQRRKRVAEMLELVGLNAQAKRYAQQLSGGQQQRVALARALAIEPKVLLLDEPLSALDAKVRVSLRDEIRRIQLSTGTTTLFVTHDQEEALAVSDRVGVMSNGRLEQIGSPTAVYQDPSTSFVARFVGTVNEIPGRVGADGKSVEVGGRTIVSATAERLAPGSAVRALVRPEGLLVMPLGDGGSGFVGTVVTAAFQGSVVRVKVRLDDTDALVNVDAPVDSIEMPNQGDRVRIKVEAKRAFVETPAAGAETAA